MVVIQTTSRAERKPADLTSPLNCIQTQSYVLESMKTGSAITTRNTRRSRRAYSTYRPLGDPCTNHQPTRSQHRNESLHPKYLISLGIRGAGCRGASAHPFIITRNGPKGQGIRPVRDGNRRGREPPLTPRNYRLISKSSTTGLEEQLYLECEPERSSSSKVSIEVFYRGRVVVVW